MKFPAGDAWGEISAVETAKKIRTFMALEGSWLILVNYQDDTTTWKLLRSLKTEKAADNTFERERQKLDNGYLVLVIPSNIVRSVVAH